MQTGFKFTALYLVYAISLSHNSNLNISQGQLVKIPSSNSAVTATSNTIYYLQYVYESLFKQDLWSTSVFWRQITQMLSLLLGFRWIPVQLSCQCGDSLWVLAEPVVDPCLTCLRPRSSWFLHFSAQYRISHGLSQLERPTRIELSLHKAVFMSRFVG